MILLTEDGDVFFDVTDACKHPMQMYVILHNAQLHKIDATVGVVKDLGQIMTADALGDILIEDEYRVGLRVAPITKPNKDWFSKSEKMVKDGYWWVRVSDVPV